MIDDFDVNEKRLKYFNKKATTAIVGCARAYIGVPSEIAVGSARSRTRRTRQGPRAT